MTKEEYNLKLKEVGLSKKQLANILGVAVQTVNNWGSSQKFPRWVKSWLENYIDKKKFENIKEMLRGEV